MSALDAPPGRSARAGRVPGASPRASRGGGAGPGGGATSAPSASGVDDERPEDDDTGWGDAAPAPEDDRYLRERPPHWG